MPSAKGRYGKTTSRPRSMSAAMSTADFNRKIAAVKANPSLTPAQKQSKIKKMNQTRIAKKTAMKSSSKRR